MRRLAVACLLSAGCLLLAGCALPDVTTIRLPGAAGGSHTYPVTVSFDDVLDLVPNSTVRVADVPVGRVERIDVAPGGPTGHVAVVHLRIDDAVQLPANTVAAIRNTSLLGEKYVALVAPADGAGSLRQTGSIPLSATSDDVEVEEILGTLGAVLTDGGLQQLSTITQQFSAALGGHEQDTRDLLGRLDQLVGQLDANRDLLVTAIDSAARLSTTLAAQKQVIGDAVVALDPATGVLAQDQKTLDQALAALDRLSASATGLVQRSTAVTAADLAALSPTAQELGKVAGQIPADLSTLVTYPFADNSVRSFSGAYGAFKGDLNIDLTTLLKAVVPAEMPADDTGTVVTGPTATLPATPTVPTSPTSPSSPTSPGPTAAPTCGLVSALLGACA